MKRNASKIQYLIDNSPDLKGLHVGVEGAVVFTNNHATLHVNNPPVAVLRLAELPNHITSYRHSSNLSREQIVTIGREISKH